MTFEMGKGAFGPLIGAELNRGFGQYLDDIEAVTCSFSMRQDYQCV